MALGISLPYRIAVSKYGLKKGGGLTDSVKKRWMREEEETDSN